MKSGKFSVYSIMSIADAVGTATISESYVNLSTVVVAPRELIYSLQNVVRLFLEIHPILCRGR